MASIATLSEQLQQYEALGLNQYSALNECLQQVEQWQHQRIQIVHAELFNAPKHQHMAQFFFNRLYNISNFELLADQLKKAASEKVKLENFVPENVMKTAELGLQLGLTSLTLDMQLAFFCFANQLEINNDGILQALIQYRQLDARQHQLAQLRQLGEAFHHYSKSFLIQAGLSLAKGTASRRGYEALYDFLSEGFKAMRQVKSITQFFETFIAGEIAILEHVEKFHRFPSIMLNQSA